MLEPIKLKSEIKKITENLNYNFFLPEFLRLYNIPNATLVRQGILQGIEINQPIIISNKLSYFYTTRTNLYSTYDYLKQTNKSFFNNIRLILIMNQKAILAFDSKTGDFLTCQLNELSENFDFFFPLAGIERNRLEEKKTLNIQIGEKIASFYNELMILNKSSEIEVIKTLRNLIITFFCDGFGYFKDTNLYNILINYTKEDGSDLYKVLLDIFQSLNGNIRDEYFECIDNCNFFIQQSIPLQFNKKTRKSLLDITAFDWSTIEPEALGSIIQNIVIPDDNQVKYNYTSTANIYKVIGPLFMNNLNNDFENLKSQEDIIKFLERLSNIRIFDPACGTGNFLIVTYRELKKLEEAAKKQLLPINEEYKKKEYINVTHFYGIEEKTLAADITKIGIFFLGKKNNEIIKIDKINIINANPLRIDWNKFCSEKNHIVFIIGNPSYKGKKLSIQQKEDMEFVFYHELKSGKKIGELDYCTCWFYLASKFINGTDSGFAFVTTNSLTQGTHVPSLWSMLFSLNIYISFGYTSFKWKNTGRNNTAVTVVIIGCLDKRNKQKKYIYNNENVYIAESISPYLTKGDIIVKEERTPLNPQLPKMIKGNMPYGKQLLLEPEEKNELVNIYPNSKKFLRRVVGSDEYINSIERWCLWIKDEEYEEAKKIPLINERLEEVREFRETSTCTEEMKRKPYKFRETNEANLYTLVIPAVTSENREYFQIGYVNKNIIVTNLCFAIYDAEPWVMGILISKIHNLWVRTVCGGLETRPRYSNVLGYNTFPLPILTDEQKNIITDATLQVIIEREKYSELSFAELYNPDKMPESLKIAHVFLDKVIDNLYQENDFNNNQERLNKLFMLYKEIKEKV